MAMTKCDEPNCKPVFQNEPDTVKGVTTFKARVVCLTCGKTTEWFDHGDRGETALVAWDKIVPPPVPPPPPVIEPVIAPKV